MTDRTTRHNTTAQQITITNRRRMVSANLLAGATYREIANALKVSPATIASDYRAIIAEWREHYAKKADELLNIQLRRYDVLLNAIWDRAKNGDTQAIDRALTIMDKQNALMGIHKGDSITVLPQNIQIVEVNRTYLNIPDTD